MDFKKLLVFAFIPFLFTGCDNNSGKQDDDKDKLVLTLDTTNLSLSEEKTYQLTLTTSFEVATEPTWTSKDSSVATVSNEGLVTAVKEGNTQIIVNIDDSYAVCSVTVTPFEPEAALSVNVSQASYTIYKDSEIDVDMVVKYGKETITDYTLSSVVGDPSIVSTSGNTIKALNTGETNVVFAVSYLGFIDEVSIKIKVI